jgi:hypothetical protein
MTAYLTVAALEMAWNLSMRGKLASDFHVFFRQQYARLDKKVDCSAFRIFTSSKGCVSLCVFISQASGII